MLLALLALSGGSSALDDLLVEGGKFAWDVVQSRCRPTGQASFVDVVARQSCSTTRWLAATAMILVRTVVERFAAPTQSLEIPACQRGDTASCARLSVATRAGVRRTMPVMLDDMRRAG